MPVPASIRILALALFATAVACERAADTSSVVSPDANSAAARAGADVTVSSAVPGESPRDTTLDVQINGSGFDKTAQATLPLHGVVDPRVHVNSTRYVKSTQVVANVTISADAALDSYDVVVALSSGKKGIGTEAFIVVMTAETLTGGYHVRAIGPTGDAVGDAVNPNPTSTCSGSVGTVWRVDGTRITLPVGANCSGGPQGINASGVIEGNLSGGVAESGLWFPSGDTYTLQEVPPTPDGYRPIVPGALNDNNELFGWVAGSAKLFWYSAATGWLPMQVPAGATACQSFQAINNRGELAATCTVNGVRNAYYWQTHDAAPVMLPRPATGDVVAYDMNDNGVIVGYGTSNGLRWTPSPSGYVLDIFPAGSVLHAIASDGTIAGSITLQSVASGPSPAIFYSPTSYQLLGVPDNGRWGEALGITLTTIGIVVGGHEANSKALRWKASTSP